MQYIIKEPANTNRDGADIPVTLTCLLKHSSSVLE